jgi:hypothetical protein
MNRIALVLLCASLSFVPVTSAFAQAGPTTVTPRGDGPIPKGKSDVVDNVLKSLGWSQCQSSWMANSWCSPTKKY